MSFEAFDLAVLEYYTNDDISGSISYRDESIPPNARDAVVVQTLGFSYDDELNRAVAVFLRYLADLSPEHQQVWRAGLLEGSYKLHPDCYRAAILGHWPEAISIFDAFGSETPSHQ